MSSSLLETILYAPNPAACARFYTDLVGHRPIREPSETSAAWRVGPGSVLLIFDPSVARRAGRGVPTHGAEGDRGGAGHVAFRVEDLDAMRERLLAGGVEIELERAWGPPDFNPGRSIYVRDPAGNSVEFLDADIWPA